MGTGAVGRVALGGATVLAAAAVVLALVAWRTRTIRWHRYAVRALTAGVAAAVVAVGTLAWGLLTMDFSLAAVASTTNRSTTWPYRLAGMWGDMAGSLLWWSALLGVVALAGLRTTRRRLPQLERPATLIVAITFVSFLALDTLFANPFRTLDVPSLNGVGLVPILRHPAMLYHPPIVYLGLVALVVPFAISVAAAVSGTDDRWAGTVVRWLTASWVLLTAGMAAGGHWAYAEQGWGGFWAWDPVENGVLLPWLAVTAAVHTAALHRRRFIAPRLAALAALAFVLACLGALLTRSGATESVHAFAETRAVGRGLLAFVTIGTAAVAVVLIQAWRRHAPVSPSGPTTAKGVLLTVNNILLLLIAAIVFVGTLTPVVTRLVSGTRLAVDAHFFGVFTAPLAAIGIVLALASLALARRSPAAVLAHVGLTLVLVGAAASATGTTTQLLLSPGQTATVHGWHITLERLTSTPKIDRVQVRAHLRIAGHGHDDLRLHPGIDAYGPSAPPLPELSLHSTPASDLQIAVRRIDPTANRADLDVYVKPLVWWVWWGALLMTAGGVVSLVRRWRRTPPPTMTEDVDREADEMVSAAAFVGAGASPAAR